MSLFATLDLKPEDPLFSLPILFNADQNPQKVNLGIGAYRTDEGTPLVMHAVQEAEKLLLEKKLPKEYLSIEGDKEYIQAVQELVFGAEHLKIREGNVYGVQAVGGTSAIRSGVELLKKDLTLSGPLLIPSSTWPNHILIAQKAEFAHAFYPYYDSAKHSIAFDQLVECLSQQAPHTPVILQVSCHNPTGCDLTQEQWKELSALMFRKQLFPFFDLSYQGFGSTLEEDAYPIRLFADEGHEMLVAVSFSKNFGLYSERVGALLAVVQDPKSISLLSSHLKQIIRADYSNPPAHGAKIVKTILKTPVLRKEWEFELNSMKQRLQKMRKTFTQHLQEKLPSHSFHYIDLQKGFFAYTDLSQEQVLQLRKKYSIYMPSDGRVNLAGLNSHNIEYVIQALCEVIKST